MPKILEINIKISRNREIKYFAVQLRCVIYRPDTKIKNGSCVEIKNSYANIKMLNENIKTLKENIKMLHENMKRCMQI